MGSPRRLSARALSRQSWRSCGGPAWNSLRMLFAHSFSADAEERPGLPAGSHDSRPASRQLFDKERRPTTGSGATPDPLAPEAQWDLFKLPDLLSGSKSYASSYALLSASPSARCHPTTALSGRCGPGSTPGPASATSPSACTARATTYS